MTMKLNIPTTIADKAAFPQVKALDRKIIAAAVLLGLPNQDAFKLYHPEFVDSSGKLNKSGQNQSSMFWAYGKNREYREQYEKELAEFLGRSQTNSSGSLGADISEADITKALRAMLRYVVENAVDMDNLEDPATFLKIADKTGLFDRIEQKEELPRRYLPVRCRQECQYRVFCEQAMENGEIENECTYCKALAYAIERGYRYDPTTNLSIPIKENENENEQ